MTVTRVLDRPSISSFSQETWDELATDAFHTSWSWLRSQEGGRRTVGRVLALEKADQLIAAAPLLGLLDEGIAIVGARTGYQNKLLTFPKLTATERIDAVAQLSSAVNVCADQMGGWQATWPHLNGADAAALLKVNNATLHFDGAATVISGWNSDISSDRRRRIAREVDAFAASGWRVRKTGFSDSDVPVMANLTLQNIRKHGGTSTEDRVQEFLYRQAKFASNSCILLKLLDPTEGLQGFSMLFRWRSTLYARIVGFNYPSLTGSFEYFNLAFYLPFDIMEESNLTSLHMGTGAYEPKVRRGARLEPLWRVVTNRSDPGATEDALAAASAFAAEWSARKSTSIDMSQWYSPLDRLDGPTYPA